MYPYKYNMSGNNRNIRKTTMPNPSDDRFFFPGGFFVPFILGGLAGGAIANNKNQNNYSPYPYPPYPAYYNNYYYYPNQYPY